MFRSSTSKLFAFLSFSVVLTAFSCSKDDDKDRDNLPPVVTLNGNSTVNVFLNQPYTDQGATANDATDGNVSVTSDVTPENPNTNTMGSYTIKYTAQDNNQNKGYGYRTVIVENEAAGLAGTYVVTSISGIDTIAYYSTVTIDKNINNRIHFSELGMFWYNSRIFADLTGGILVIPQQFAVNIGIDNGQPCDVANHMFESTNCTMTSNGFILEYTDEITVPASCQGTTTHTATFVKQ